MNDADLQEFSPDELLALKAASAVDSEATQLGRQIWQMALAGKDRDHIARSLKLSLEVLDESLNAFRLRLALSVDHYRLLDNQRLEEIISYWMPVATGKENFENPLKATYAVLLAMDRRVKIMMGTRSLDGTPGMGPGSPENAQPYNERQVVIWLREVLPGIEKITRELESSNPNGAHNGESL